MIQDTINKLAFGFQLKNLRESHQFSQRALAEKLQISASYLRSLETSQKHPNRELVLNIADIFFPSEYQKQDQLLVLCGFLPHNYKAPKVKPNNIEIHQQLLKENPHDFKAYLSLVLILIRSGKELQAQEMIEMGMAIFDELAQLQSLCASLELSKDNLDTAIEYQTSAIKYFRLEEDKKRLEEHITLPDLLLSLGIMHFIKSNRHMIQKELLIEEKRPQKAAHEHHLADKYLTQARECFTEALIQNPSDIYTLDEMARVIFNQAFLIQEQSDAIILWNEAIQAFEKVIQSQDKHVLGTKNLTETNLFMVHAFTKSGQFEKSLYLLNIIEAASPENWFVYYTKACFFSLKSETIGPDEKGKASDLLAQALDSLNKGLWLTEGASAITKNTPIDPDLKNLRLNCQSELEQLLETSKKPLGGE